MRGMRGVASRGQGIVEYGLIMSLTMALTTLILGVFGGALADVLTAIGAAIDAATGAGCPVRGGRKDPVPKGYWLVLASLRIVSKPSIGG
jgi:Flp pilus assembly pilin Flp